MRSLPTVTHRHIEKLTSRFSQLKCVNAAEDLTFRATRSGLFEFA